MKFGKEFDSQMVPEWREAYMNYNYLKTLLNEISISRTKSNPRQSKKASFKRKVSLFRAFSGLTSTPKKANEDDQVIMISAMQPGDDQEEQGQDVPTYQTIFLRSLEKGGEFELVFFRILDREFNKVIRFYRTKVDEVVKEAEELNIQMDALVALRIKVNNPVFAAVSPFVNETNTGNLYL